MTVPEWHNLFELLADLTRGTESWNEVAERFKSCSSLHTCTDPFDSSTDLQNRMDKFTETLCELFFIPCEHDGWTEEDIHDLRGRVN